MSEINIDFFPVFKPDQDFLDGVGQINKTLKEYATFKRQANVIFGAYMGQKLVGFSQGLAEYKTAKNRVLSLYVNKQVKDENPGKKLYIGRQLLNETERVLSLCSDKIELVSTTGAQIFYDKQGYRSEYDDEYLAISGELTKKLDIHNIHSGVAIFPLFWWDSKSADRLKQIVAPLCDRIEDAVNICQSVDYSINSAKNPAWGAWIDGALMGVLSGSVNEKQASANIDNLYVDQKTHNAGLGRNLVNEFVRFAGHRGAANVNVNAQFDAISFYKKLGFRELYGDFDCFMQKTL